MPFIGAKMKSDQGLTKNTSSGMAMRCSLLAVPYCPITGNQPLRCTRESFARMCATHRRCGIEAQSEGSTIFSGRRNHYCPTCKGEILPKGVEFIEIDQLLEEGTMARTTVVKAPVRKGANKKPSRGVTGKCDSCGKEKQGLSQRLERMLCPTCSMLNHYAKTRPELLLESLRCNKQLLPEVAGEELAELSQARYEIDKMEKLVKEFGLKLEDARKELAVIKTDNDRLRALQVDIESTAQFLRNELSAHKSLRDGQEEAYEHQLATLRAQIAELERNDQTTFHDHHDTVDQMREQITAGRDKIEQLQAMLVASAAEVNRLRAIEDAYLNDRQVFSTLEQTSRPGRDAALLDIALDVLAGKVSGIGYSQLLALREVA